MPADNVTDYVGYFRNIAITHKDIQHKPASETGDGKPGDKRFTRWGIDEVVTGLRTQMGWPALLLELYETQTSGQTMYDVKGNNKGAFTVLDKALVNNYSSEMEAFTKTEAIVKDILKKIWQDLHGESYIECNTPFSQFSFDNLEIIPVGPLFDNQFGWRVEYSFRPRLQFDISTPPAPGTFLLP